VTQRMSTAFHPQTDGASEKTNAVVLQAMRGLVQEGMTDWVKVLPTVELMLNATPSAVTKVSPFEMAYGRRARLPLSQEAEVAVSFDTSEWITKLKGIWRATQEAVEKRKEQNRSSKNDRRIRPDLRKGDKVMVRASVLGRSGNKFSRVWEGPFLIDEVRGNGAYKVKLPSRWRHHPVMNIEHLRWVSKDIPLYHENIDVVEEIVEEDKEYVVEALLSRRRVDGNLCWFES